MKKINFPLEKQFNSEVRNGEKFFKFLFYIFQNIKNNELVMNKIHYNKLTKYLKIENSKNIKSTINRYIRVSRKLNFFEGDNAKIKLKYPIQNHFSNLEINKNNIIKENIINIFLHEIENTEILKIIYILCDNPKINYLSKNEIALITFEIKEAEDNGLNLNLNDIRTIIRNFRQDKNKYSHTTNIKSFKNLIDYADTLINYLNETSCFIAKSHAGKIIKLNPSYQDRINFFIDSDYNDRKIKLNNKTFNNDFYNLNKIKMIKKNNYKNINDVITNPISTENEKNNYYDKRFHGWEFFEYYNTLFLIDSLYKNDINTHKYSKKAAIKLENGSVKKASSSGVGDCSVKLDNIIINIESTLLDTDYNQMTKEYYPIQEHMNKELKSSQYKKGIILFVAPIITEKFLEHINMTNNNSKNEDFFIIPLNCDDYEYFLSKYNNNNSFEKLYNKLKNIKEKKYFYNDTYKSL